jgi:hypothetical protein
MLATHFHLVESYLHAHCTTSHESAYVQRQFHLFIKYCLFLLTWSLGEKQSEECYATECGVGWLYSSASQFQLGHVVQSRNSQLQPSSPYSNFQTTHCPWLNVKMWQHNTVQDRNISYHCQVTTGGFGCPNPLSRLAVVISNEGQAS